MRIAYLATIATIALAAGAVSAVYSVRADDYCPQPSAASVTALFAPCQAFQTATGLAITRDEAMQMGLLPPSEWFAPTPGKQPAAPSPAQLVTEDFRTMAQEHATVGVSK
jgi:hypothetical protein